MVTFPASPLKIPDVGFGERGTGNAAMGAGLRPGAKATDKPPDPKAGAPAPDSTTNLATTLGTNKNVSEGP